MQNCLSVPFVKMLSFADEKKTYINGGSRLNELLNGKCFLLQG